ncbi:unknown [Prevotella sp. CAG:592]|jgi:hypothetical protein|nr:unknown [Prevotella sp. CAG:592]
MKNKQDMKRVNMTFCMSCLFLMYFCADFLVIITYSRLQN